MEPGPSPQPVSARESRTRPVAATATLGERVLELSERNEQGWSVVAIKGRLDSVTAGQFTERCAAWTLEGKSRIVLDLSSLSYVSSAGLSSILGAAKGVSGQGGRLVIAGLAGLVKEVFSISGFDTILPTFPDVESAVRAS